MSARMSERSARKRPSSSSATVSVVRLSRPCASAVKCSVRSLVHLTGRPSRSAASAQSGYSRKVKILVPKPPPTSGVITRMRAGSTPSTNLAIVSRMAWTPWLHTVRVHAAPSYWARQERGSR